MLGFGRWQTGTATVVARRLLKKYQTSQTAAMPAMTRRRFEFILDVEPDDGSPQFRATCVDSAFDPVQGDTILVLCKPADQKVKFDAARMRHPERHRSRPTRTKAETDRWHEMKRDEPGTPPPARQKEE